MAADKLDFLSAHLYSIASQAQRAAAFADMGAVADARAAMEQIVKPLVAAGKIVRQLENAKVRAVAQERSEPVDSGQ